MNYEVHITVLNGNIPQFKKDCEEIGVKSVLIETQNGSNFGNQLMTSSKYDSGEYMDRLCNISQFLTDKGYKVIRNKVEIFPEAYKNKNFIYYESHLRLKLPKGFDRNYLSNICSEDFHLSKNLFKTSVDFDYQMITYRTYDQSLHIFRRNINNMLLRLNKIGVQYDKVEIEECIYDSNIEVDKSWLNYKSGP